MTQYATIAELQNFIVLNSYTKAAMLNETPAGYQTEAQLKIIIKMYLIENKEVTLFVQPNW